MGIDLRPPESQARDLLKRLPHQASSARDQPSRFHREPTWPRSRWALPTHRDPGLPRSPLPILQPTQTRKEGPAPTGPKGSLLDHTCFQLRILLQEKRKCCSHFPPSLSCLPAPKRETFQRRWPIHSEGSQADRKAPSPLEPRTPGTRPSKVRPPVPPPKSWGSLLSPWREKACGGAEMPPLQAERLGT